MDPFLVLALLSLQWKLFYLGFPPRGNRGKREISSNESNFTKKIQKVLISRNYFPSFLGTTNYTTLCPFGQEFNEEFCVKLITKKLKWQEAQNYCQTTFGPKSNLVEIDTKDDLNNLMKMYKTHMKKLWLGFTDKNSSKNDFKSYSNPNQRGLKFTNFQSNRPSNIRNFNCLVMDLKTGLWFDENCGNSLKFACMIPRAH